MCVHANGVVIFAMPAWCADFANLTHVAETARAIIAMYPLHALNSRLRKQFRSAGTVSLTTIYYFLC